MQMIHRSEWRIAYEIILIDPEHNILPCTKATKRQCILDDIFGTWP